MAKQKGIVTLVGTLDGINFYTRKGKAVARKAGGGFTGAKIKKSPNMVRVRENNSEFANCSRFKKQFKDALHPFFRDYKNGDLHGKMMRLFLAIKDCDLISERGKRSIANGLQTQMGQELLLQFQFTGFHLSFLRGSFNPITSAFSLDGFAVSMLPFPIGSTHLIIDYGVLLFDSNFSKAVLHKSSTSLTIAKNCPFDDTLFGFDSALPFSEMWMGILTYRFVQEVNGHFYPLKDQSFFGLQVVGINF
ncbi:hypothetical protein FIA58_016640 [Flavobacterium jejuense]|uniref:Uncharacterized protein n=1 Tax=Flavobacterium jejuense TaxID=1544455 RepID=A0ABX0IVU8_9FLAO|nr:hypothetical protein [Flavobacterium jejuense]NHN27310.1 hypothetical protein [Flavobacterium jejuense]